MGWTTCLYASNWKYVNGRRIVDRKKECDQICTWERKESEKGFDGRIYPPMKDTVLKSAMVGSIYYAAVRREKAGEEPYVWAAVFKTCGKSSHDGTIWGYKDMSEDMNPFFYDCPAGILALLTPTDSEGANEWRRLCRERLAEKAAERKNGPKPPFVPAGVSVTQKGHSWIITSDAYRQKVNYRYCGVRFSKARWHEVDNAMLRFLEEYGTKEQRAEYAASGRECPAEWKGAAA